MKKDNRNTTLLNRNTTLLTKINITITLFVTSFVFVLGVIIVHLISEELLTESKYRANELSELFAKINTLPLMKNDAYTMLNNTQEIIKNKHICYAEIRDKSGYQFTHIAENFDEKHTPYIYKVSKDIFGKDNQVIGRITLGLLLTDVIQKINFLKFVFLFATILIAILLSYAISILLKRIIIAPLQNLTNSVKTISSGNLDYKITINSNDEISYLASEFNAMTHKLKHRITLIDNIFNTNPNILISLDTNGSITNLNTAAELLFGITKAKVLGQKLWNTNDFFTNYKAEFFKLLNNPKTVSIYRRKKIIKINDIERIFYFNITIAPIYFENKLEGFLVIITDETEHERKEEQLRQAQKMESIGTLAGGLAHDFNNILGGIIGTISILKLKYSKKASLTAEEVKKHIATIEQSGKRATDLVQQLLTLSRKGTVSFAPVDLNLTIKHVLKICNTTFDKKIEINHKPLEDPAIVDANPTQLEQVLLNICINAYHAMSIMREDKSIHGTLTITLKQFIVDKFLLETTDLKLKEGSYWNISVNDTGVGMKKETTEKIFNPFFTTKAKGMGTGLGLSMVYNIINQHQGFVRVYSELGTGTTFDIFLPVSKEVNVNQEKEQKITITPGTGTILVIDDEEVMRDIASKMLNACGYQVVTANDGQAGIEKYRESKNKIDLVLLDIIMPKMTGNEVFEVLKKDNPDLKILLTSGFKNDDRLINILENSDTQFIQKPYTVDKLSKKIAEILKN